MQALRSWRLWVASLTTAAVLTALTTAQTYASRRVEGVTARLDRIIPIQAIDWFAWALLAPAVIAIASTIEWRDRPRGRLAGIWLLLALGFAAAHALIEVIVARSTGVVPTQMPFTTMLPARLAETLVGSVIVAALLVLSYYAVKHYSEAVRREQREATLEARLAEAQLNVLRHQLQPHFLFNTLHTVSALIRDDVDGARTVLARLGDLLRSSLDGAELHEVPLRDELRFLEHYVDIQRTRFGERLRVLVTAEQELEHALVPSMILQPLVENALRHAVEPRSAGGTIRVSARRDADRLRLEVSDDGPGLGTRAPESTGIGLSNTRQRLEHLYGRGQTFSVGKAPEGGVQVVMILPVRTA